MKPIIIMLILCSIWFTTWSLLYDRYEKNWMLVVASGPIMWILSGCYIAYQKMSTLYWAYNYKALLVDESGNIYYYESEKADDICEKYNLNFAFEETKNISKLQKYKAYKSSKYGFKASPRYVWRKYAKQYPKYCFKMKTKKYIV